MFGFINGREYWAKRREIEAGLPEELFITSLHDPLRGLTGGVTSEVSRTVAARIITERAARVATDAEIAAYREGQERQKAGALAAAQLKAGRGTFTMSPAKGKGK